jgi:hypothetical protein
MATGFCLFTGLWWPGCSHSQELFFNDSLLVGIDVQLPGDNSLVLFRFRQQFDYKLSFSGLINFQWEHDPAANHVALLGNLNYNSSITNERRLKFQASVIQDLGFQIFFDSITRFFPDATSIISQLEVKINRCFIYSVNTNLTSRIFNDYRYLPDQNGDLVKRMQSGFLTPMIVNFSSGFGWNLPSWGSVSLGLTGGKFTFIRSREIFGILKVEKYYGVLAGKQTLIEYGISLLVTIDRNLAKTLKWTCEMMLFKNYIKPVDITVKSLLEWRFGRNLSGSLQTRLFYEEAVSKKLQIDNIITLGFGIRLR